MKRVLRTLSICLFLATGLSLTVNAQQEFKTTRKSVIGYLEYLPKDYKKNSEDYPVLIFLHGIGERGPNSTDPKKLEKESSELTKLGPPYHVKKGVEFPFIIISPQLKSNYGDWPSWYVLEVIEHVKTYLRIDERRIYLTGLSLGGGGVWTAAEDYPDLFAAVAPVCGSRNSTKKAEAIAKNNLPVWAFHGDKDNVVPLSRSANMVDAINGFKPNPRAKLSVYPGVRHDAWHDAYRPDNSKHKPNMYEWMLSFKKGSAPTVENKAPSVDAGKDLTVAESQSKLEIKGSAADSDGKIKTLKWTKSSGGDVKMEGASTEKLVISKFSAGSYTFRLTATDDKGASKYAEVKVTVTKESNKVPSVSAGADITATTKDTKVTFQGSASDSDGKIKKWQWKQQSGGTVKLEGAETAKLTVSKFTEGSYRFRLTVTDDKGATKYDEVNLTVKKAASSNKAPTVSAGKDIAAKEGGGKVTFQGTASDSDGKIKKWEWKQQSGGTVKLEGAQSAKLSVSNYKKGEYKFRLTVTDDKGATSYDEVKLIVEKESNKAPTVNAGKDIVAKEGGSKVTFQGTASDSDGKIKKWQWKQQSGGTVKLEGAQSAKLSVSNYKKGEYKFRLTVTDDKGTTSYDEVKLIVEKTSNSAPTVDAGKDIVVKEGSGKVNLQGTASDKDGTIKKYQWKQQEGGRLKMETAQTSRLVISEYKEGKYRFRLTVTDDKGATAYDEVTVTVQKNNSDRTPGVLEAFAGTDRQARLPIKETTIAGGATSPDKIVSYEWRQVGGTSVKLSNAKERVATISNVTSAGARTFELKVKDAAGRSATDRIIINFLAPKAASYGEVVVVSDPFGDEEEEADPFSAEQSSESVNWTDKYVVVYNESGRQIFSGKWKEDSFAEVFNASGLYIYHVRGEGDGIKKGKLYIQ